MPEQGGRGAADGDGDEPGEPQHAERRGGAVQVECEQERCGPDEEVRLDGEGERVRRAGCRRVKVPVPWARAIVRFRAISSHAAGAECA